MQVTACLNGARLPHEHPALPVTAQELADAAGAAVEAGATALHLHIKDAGGVDTLEAAPLTAALRLVRWAAPGVRVGVTTGAWIAPDPPDRVRAIASWTALPDAASVNWHEDGAELVARALLGKGVEVEAGLWHEDAVRAWAASALRDRCARVLLELPDGLDEDEVMAQASRLLQRVEAAGRAPGGVAPLRRSVQVHGEGSSAWPAVRVAARLGLQARIGLEDVLTLPDGTVAADNAELVRAARTVADEVVSRTSGRLGWAF